VPSSITAVELIKSYAPLAFGGGMNIGMHYYISSIFDQFDRRITHGLTQAPHELNAYEEGTNGSRGVTRMAERSSTISRTGQEVVNYWRGETYKQVQPSECQLEPQLSVNNPVDKLIELPVHSPFGMQRSQINPNHAHTDRSPP